MRPLLRCLFALFAVIATFVPVVASADAGRAPAIVDVRPLVFARLGQTSALVCHPYDICTELILREAGAVIESPDGKPLRAPLDTTSPVSWFGFANPHLARLARPALRRALQRLL